MVKNLPAKAGVTGDLGLIPGLGRSPGEENGNPLQYSGLGKFHGQRSLVGNSPYGSKESDRTERLRMRMCHLLLSDTMFDFLFLHPLDLSHEQSRGYLGTSLLRTHCLSCELTSLELRTQSQPAYKNTSPQCHTLRWVRKSIKLYFTNKTNSYNMRWEAALIFLRPDILPQVI